eukprot:1436178-Amphidinium_carterae.1
MGNVEGLNKDGLEEGAGDDDEGDLELKVVRKRCRCKGPASRLTTVVVEKKRKSADEEPLTVKKQKREPWPKDQTVIAATTRYEQGFDFGVPHGAVSQGFGGAAAFEVTSGQGFSFSL